MDKHPPKPDWNPADDDVLNDPPAAYDALRERCPVAYSDRAGWSVFRHANVRRVIDDHRTFSNAVSAHVSIPNGMDPPEHTVYRRLIEPYFAPARMRAFEPRCREMAAGLIRNALAAGDIEVMADLARPFAVQVQCAFLGWPETLHEPLIRWSRDNQRATLERDRETLSELAGEFEGFIERMLDTRRRTGVGPESDLTAALMHERVDGRALNNREIAGILRNWTAGEIGTIAAAVGIIVEYLGRERRLQNRLRDEPSLLPHAIDEILRIHGPLIANRRVATCPVELGGRRIEAGEPVSVNWIAANRDGRVFDEPLTFRLDRDPADNLLYGAGIHVCPGAPLARLELRTVTEQLLEQTTSVDLSADRPPVRATRPAAGFDELAVRLG